MKNEEKTIVFFGPFSPANSPPSGSSVRPEKMREGFQANAVRVISIAGTSGERRRKWRALDMEKENIVGVYAELSTMPLALTDPDHLPRHPFLDMKMFRKMRTAGIPVAVFYRDVYWRFSQYKREVYPVKRRVAEFFYNLELRQMVRSVSHLFLPSLRMFPEIPVNFPLSRVSALPPGGEIRPIRRKTNSGPLALLSVGGVLPPLYDLSPVFDALRRVPAVFLTLCCRQGEWERVRDSYNLPVNVEVVHKAKTELDDLYGQAEVFLMFRKMEGYLKFVMPVKLFEAIGAGLPVVTNAGCEMGDFVEREGVGWALRNSNELAPLLERLAQRPAALQKRRETAEKIRNYHTWRARAGEIMQRFQDLRATGGV